MKFCPNCGFKLPVEGAKFCPDCGTDLQSLTQPRGTVSETHATREERIAKSFELLKVELPKRSGDLAKSIADALMEKWKESGKYPRRLGKVLDVVVEGALPRIIEATLRGFSWKDEAVTETARGRLETRVSTVFPLEIETGIPLVGKITLKGVRLTVAGTCDVDSGNVSELRVGALDLV